MKLNEFEDKLATVSDAKLRQMLAASRATGPDVAVKLILSECARRGMDEPETGAAHAYAPETRPPGSETTAYPQEQAGYAGSDAPPKAEGSGEAAAGTDPGGADLGPPATAPDWLNEETKAGMPVVVKVLLVVVALCGILGLAWKFSH